MELDFSKLAKDKKLHLLAGLLIGFVAAYLAHRFKVAPFMSFVTGVVIAAVIGYAKEQWDKRHAEEHTYDMEDARYTLAGGLPGAVLGVLMPPFI